MLGVERNYSYMRTQWRKAGRYNIRLKEKYQNHQLTSIMKNAGVPFSLYHYQLFRFSLLGVGIITALINFSTTKTWNTFQLTTILIVFAITIPSERFLGFRSPFQFILNFSQRRKRSIYNQELYLAISQMKNSFLVYKDKAPSSQKILEEISQYTEKLRPVLHKFLSFWMVGEREQAVAFFDKEIGTPEASKLSQIFLKLDDIDPYELNDQLETFQNIYRTQRETEKKKQDEFKSYILFAATITSALMILFNFIIVGYFIDFMKSLKEII